MNKRCAYCIYWQGSYNTFMADCNEPHNLGTRMPYDGSCKAWADHLPPPPEQPGQTQTQSQGVPAGTMWIGKVRNQP